MTARSTGKICRRIATSYSIDNLSPPLCYHHLPLPIRRILTFASRARRTGSPFRKLSTDTFFRSNEWRTEQADLNATAATLKANMTSYQIAIAANAAKLQRSEVEAATCHLNQPIQQHFARTLIELRLFCVHAELVLGELDGDENLLESVLLEAICSPVFLPRSVRDLGRSDVKVIQKDRPIDQRQRAEKMKDRLECGIAMGLLPPTEVEAAIRSGKMRSEDQWW